MNDLTISHILADANLDFPLSPSDAAESSEDIHETLLKGVPFEALAEATNGAVIGTGGAIAWVLGHDSHDTFTGDVLPGETPKQAVTRLLADVDEHAYAPLEGYPPCPITVLMAVAIFSAVTGRVDFAAGERVLFADC